MSRDVEPWLPSIRDHPSGLMTPAEVAEVFRVNVKTVGRWRRAGKLTAVTTPSGRCRYRIEQVKALLTEHNLERSSDGKVLCALCQSPIDVPDDATVTAALVGTSGWWNDWVVCVDGIEAHRCAAEPNPRPGESPGRPRSS